MIFESEFRPVHPIRALVVLASFLSTPGWAAWTMVGEDHAVTAYADAATIVRQGHTATMSSLLDHHAFRRMVDFSFSSQTTRVQYDCGAPRFRRLSLSLHAESMGRGEVIYEDATAHDWEEIAPDTLYELLSRLACRSAPAALQ